MAKRFCTVRNKGTPLVRRRLAKTWQTSLSRVEKLSKKQTGRKMNDSHKSKELTADETMAEELMRSPALSPLIGRFVITTLAPEVVRLRTDDERKRFLTAFREAVIYNSLASIAPTYLHLRYVDIGILFATLLLTWLFGGDASIALAILIAQKFIGLAIAGFMSIGSRILAYDTMDKFFKLFEEKD
jgi:hypothetical protein